MTCEELHERLLEHRAGELPWHVVLLLRTHAAFCPGCREVIRTYGFVIDAAQDLREREIPAAVADEIRAALAKLPRQP